MIKIIPSSSYKTLPWKNGKGQTIELAINENATLENFDWRLSIASVTENGLFSNFSGYLRNLVLIDGHSIHLKHNGDYTDKLTELLDFATFDGGYTTQGLLTQGSIKDFNIITSSSKCHTIVETYPTTLEKVIDQQGLVFAFSLSDIMIVEDLNSAIKQEVQQGDLLTLEHPQHIKLVGQKIILVSIKFT
jgi:environmental stress-induced protein Ves